MRRTAQQGLRVGVGADEFHPLHGALDHVLHCVAAAATHADHLDLGALVERFFFNHFDGHVILLRFNVYFRCSCQWFFLFAGEKASSARRIGTSPTAMVHTGAADQKVVVWHDQKFPMNQSLMEPNALFTEPLFCETL